MKPTHVILAALCAATAGCASTRHDDEVRTLTQARAAAILVDGRTTKDDVRRAFGAALVDSFPGGREVWFYRYSDSAGSALRYVPLVGRWAAGGTAARELKILFDQDGHVSKFKLQEVSL